MTPTEQTLQAASARGSRVVTCATGEPSGRWESRFRL